jgi:hypothetical protein
VLPSCNEDNDRHAVGSRPDPDLAEPAAMTLSELNGKAAIVTVDSRYSIMA